MEVEEGDKIVAAAKLPSTEEGASRKTVVEEVVEDATSEPMEMMDMTADDLEGIEDTDDTEEGDEDLGPEESEE